MSVSNLANSLPVAQGPAPTSQSFGRGTQRNSLASLGAGSPIPQGVEAPPCSQSPPFVPTSSWTWRRTIGLIQWVSHLASEMWEENMELDVSRNGTEEPFSPTKEAGNRLSGD